MLTDTRIDEIKWMRDGLPRRSGKIVRQALDDLLAEREELLADSERAQEAEDNASYARAIGVDREGQL